MVEATLALLTTAMRDPRRERFVLISGADFPIRSPAYVREFLLSRPDTEFMNLTPMPSAGMNKPITRLTRCKGSPDEPLAMAGHALGKLGWKRDYRAAFEDLKPYAGSQWWALTRAACREVLDFTARRPELVRFMRNTWIPDESFFQIALGNSRFRERVGRNLTFTDWSGGRSPMSIGAAHVERFARERPLVARDAYGEGELLFARKFDDSSGDVVRELIGNWA